MNIIVGIALLILLIVRFGGEDRVSPQATEKTKSDDLARIDELEVLDAIMDDFV